MADDRGTHEVLTGWGRTAPTRAHVYEPRRTDDVAERLTAASARGVIPRGLGRSYGDAAQNGGGDVVRCTQLDRILEVDIAKGTCTVEAGVSIETLMRVFLPLGWFPMVVPGTRYVTVGGAIGSEIHGKFRHGSFADSVGRMTVATPARGALTVDHDDDVFWATAGGMGLTGIVTEATLQLQPVETAHMVVDTERAADLDDCMTRDARRRRALPVLRRVDRLPRGREAARPFGVDARQPRSAAAPAERAAPDRAQLRAAHTCSRVPPWLPNLITPLTTRAFNEMWFRKAPRERRDQVQTITAFFHPLDAVLDWNRIYGSHGFVQYQFVVPYGAEHVVRAVLERLSAHGCASFLAVLKRFEHESRAMLGFPAAGWTLALDVPGSGATLTSFLDGLDDLVVEAGGRVYLTKDARLRPELVPVMYPQLDRWREVRAALDPHHALRSDMDRRLDLTGFR